LRLGIETQSGVMSFIKCIALLCVLSYSSSHTQAQKIENSPTIADILSGEFRVAFLGIDLSETKFIGDKEDWPGAEFIKTLNPAWNNLLAYDLRKYRILPRALRLKPELVEYYPNICTIHNDKLSFGEAIMPVSFGDEINNDKIQSILDSYDFTDLTGIGLMIFIESFDAKNSLGTMYFTFLNLNTHKIIYSEKLNGNPAGVTPRKYWVETIHDVISQVQEIKYREWKKAYLR